MRKTFLHKTPVAAACALLLAAPLAALAEEATILDPVTVTAKPNMPSVETAPGGKRGGKSVVTSDSAKLLDGLPGVSLYEAGGVSSLPVVHGLADDRVRVQIDGMDLMAACPNHMNSPLSYVDATRVETVKVYAGITPVSAGGDSLGGTIQIVSKPPQFAGEDGKALVAAQVRGFFRSNGSARGADASADLAGQAFALSYTGSSAQARNYRAGNDFKPAGPAALGRGWLDGDEVGSSAYKTENQEITLSGKLDRHLLQLSAGKQHIAYELYPNQRMDMTGNDSTQLNLRYTGRYDWGELKARAFDQKVNHEMDMGPDRYFYGTGMPMLTKSRTRGGLVEGDFNLSEADVLRVGIDYQNYWLYDWWPAVGIGSMAPNTFWNIDDGTRVRTGVFGEWEARWNPRWSTNAGVRFNTVKADTGPVQGYNADPMWADDAAAFNALDRKRTDHNWDWTALARYAVNDGFAVEGGFARKTRSPNLYERYPWSTQPMASNMNNFVGDGNGYIGNPDLKPEVAHTASATFDWRDAKNDAWAFKLNAYYTVVDDYIDAVRCASSMCRGAANLAETADFVYLRYANQSARLGGFDVSGRLTLDRGHAWGTLDLDGVVNYVRGINRTSHDDLYHQMPLNAKLTLTQTLGAWVNAADLRLVTAKTRVSQVRNETTTAGYSLLDLRSSYEWTRVRLDVSVSNVFDRAYTLPLGGAYVGQGATMMSSGAGAPPWGVGIPGRGRSIDLALTVRY